MKSHVNHVAKMKFFVAFKAAFYAGFMEANIKVRSRDAGLVPLNPDGVISKLDIKLQALKPAGSIWLLSTLGYLRRHATHQRLKATS